MKTKALIAIAAALAVTACTAQNDDFARWVDPFVGTVGDGNCFPGPCRPFGMVQPSPDTGEKTHCGGYKFTDATIRHFSQTHLNGTGRPAMGDISVFPIFSTGLTGLTGLSGGVPPDPRNPVNLVNPVKKETEVAEVGYYAVTLGNGVKCEATATERVAVWRFAWPEGAARGLSIDAAAMLMQHFNAKFGATVPESSANLREDRRGMSGYKKALGWTPYKLFYAIEFSEPWANIERLPSDPFQGKGDRWVVEFDTLTGLTGLTRLSGGVPPDPRNPVNLVQKTNTLEVRIALSTVSEEGALANMKAEAGGKSFDDIRAECRASWNEIFSRAQLVKGTDEQKKNWYTALYHLCIQPNIQTDVDGKYRGADDAIHTAKRGHYSTFSLWDTFRAAHPLYTIIVPERVPGFVDSLIAFGEQHGHLPMWTMWQGEDHCMIGIHSIPVIVDAYKKGLLTGLTGLTGLSGGVPPDPRNPENLVNPVQNKLLTLMVQSMINNDGENPKNCWNAYWENGYIPYCPGEFDKFVPQGQSASTTLELAYDWWSIADFAKCIGDGQSAAKAQKWADCWKNVFDKEIGFARGRGPMTAGGKWREPFDPRNPRAGGLFWGDFTEANSWIYTWHVFQDVDALAEAFGGKSAALAKLDEFFATPPYKPTGKSANNDEGGIAEAPGQIGQYWHGNEPSHHVAYFYSLWGRRDKTAALTRRICREAYRPKPDGLCGNDDCGQMSAWYLFSMMGFYPVNPCDDGYVLGEAQAEEVKLRVGSEEFRILATKNTKNTKKCGNEKVSNSQQPIPNVYLNGEAVKGVKISHEDIMRGGTLVFGKDVVK